MFSYYFLNKVHNMIANFNYPISYFSKKKKLMIFFRYCIHKKINSHLSEIWTIFRYFFPYVFWKFKVSASYHFLLRFTPKKVVFYFKSGYKFWWDTLQRPDLNFSKKQEQIFGSTFFDFKWLYLVSQKRRKKF